MSWADTSPAALCREPGLKLDTQQVARDPQCTEAPLTVPALLGASWPPVTLVGLWGGLAEPRVVGKGRPTDAGPLNVNAIMGTVPAF